MIRTITLVVAFSLLFASGAGAETLTSATMSKEGSIAFGGGKLMVSPDASMRIIWDDGRAAEISQQFSLGKVAWTIPAKFQNREFKFDEKEKSFNFTGKIPTGLEGQRGD